MQGGHHHICYSIHIVSDMWINPQVRPSFTILYRNRQTMAIIIGKYFVLPLAHKRQNGGINIKDVTNFN